MEKMAKFRGIASKMLDLSKELVDTIPLRLDWLWFLGYDLDSESS